VVVGTTAITGKQVGFKNLGLVVVDEEQRLGVGQKEKLKVRGCLGGRGYLVVVVGVGNVDREMGVSLVVCDVSRCIGYACPQIISQPPAHTHTSHNTLNHDTQTHHQNKTKQNKTKT
jgi:hypothetical protein